MGSWAIIIRDEERLAEDRDRCRFVFGCVQLDIRHNQVGKYSGEEVGRTFHEYKTAVYSLIKRVLALAQPSAD